MLRGISLDKFKAFDNLEELSIKPLTVLCGVNSGGKSSIIKSLLLLKQSYENSSATNEATLNGQYTTNGLMKDVIYNGKGDDFSIENTFEVKYKGKHFRASSKQDISTAKELGKITGLQPTDVSYFEISVKCCIKKGKNVDADWWDKNFISSYFVRIVPQSADHKPLEGEIFSVGLRHKRKTVYDITLNNFPTVSGEKKVSEQLENCMCYFNGMRLTNLYHESEKHTVKMSDFLTNVYAVFRIVADQYKGIVYLGPLRENPKREYSISSIRTVQDSTGADTPFVLAKNQSKKLKKEINPPLMENAFFEKRSAEKETFIDAVEEWMEYFDLGQLNVESEKDILKINVKKSNIADVGFGVSQTMPIIVHGLSMDYEQTMVLEQPEIHLHPRMQMRMADFLLTLAQTNHCVIAETHSDHIINRLVRRILEAPNDELLNNIAIYFVENVDGGSKVSKIVVDRVRGITECPEEFFTQFATESGYILDAGIRNMRKKEM